MPKTDTIGRLDRRVSLYRPVVSIDDYGGEALTWEKVAEMWAGVSYTDTGSDERALAAQETAVQRLIFTVRYAATCGRVGEKMKIEYEGQDYDILTVQEIGRRQFLKIATERRI
jgi:SPP1 family predicted phage head-tail adaptor